MFGFLFGWRKASKCKKLIKQVQCRLKLLKNKRCSIVRLIREDMAELIKIGNEEIAFNRAEQLFKDENTMAVYELLENFCEFIRMNMSYIRKRKDCPNDINEAVSSLIFASSRCGDLPELPGIRTLFEDRYGQKFVMAAAKLFPGNLVNHQIKEKLNLKAVPDEMKQQLVDEIAKDYCLRPEILAIEYATELQQVQDLYVDSSVMRETTHSYRNSDAVSTSISSSMIQQSSPDILESPIHNKAGRAKDFARCDPYESGFVGDHTQERRMSVRIYAATPEQREERIMTGASSTESLPKFPEDKVVYLDDVEEFQSSITENGDFQDKDQRVLKFKPSALPKTETADTENGDFQDKDQRVLKFKPSALPKKETADTENGDFQDKDQRVLMFKPSALPKTETADESRSEKSSSKSVKASGKRSRRRSLSRENSRIKDIECEIYYDKPCKSSKTNKQSSHHHRKYQKKAPAKEGKQSFCAEKKLKQVCCEDSGTIFQSCNFNLEMHDCNLEHSCCCIGDLKCENLCDHLVCCHCFLNPESEEEMGRPTLVQKQRRTSYDSRASEYNVFTYPDPWPNEQIQKTICAIPEKLHPKETNSLTGKRTPPPYLTVKTMPPERPKETRPDNILRCNSLPIQHPDHVHPKLPDYDDIAAKFMALKKELLQNKR